VLETRAATAPGHFAIPYASSIAYPSSRSITLPPARCAIISAVHAFMGGGGAKCGRDPTYALVVRTGR
jgi:hypothetical protein